MRRVAALVAVAVAAVLVAPVAGADRPARRGDGARVLEHHGRWESGYGAKFYNVVGRLKNTSSHPLRYVKLRIDALDAKGRKVASIETYNESAEVLAVEGLPGDVAERLKAMQPKPLAAGAEERFRGGFMADETPAFTSYRVEVVETPAVAR
jgi:hypothetical protein